MRRKPGALVPLEISILEAGLDLRRSGMDEFHGFRIAKEVKAIQGARMLTAHGTLYRALSRLSKGGLLADRWEDPLDAAEDNRPRRRLYRITALGEAALANAQAAREAASLGLRGQLARP